MVKSAGNSVNGLLEISMPSSVPSKYIVGSEPNLLTPVELLAEPCNLKFVLPHWSITFQSLKFNNNLVSYA